MNRPDERLPDEMWDTKLVPLLDLMNVLGHRWALRIIWELCERPATFRDLLDRARPVSSSVLTTRLRELREAGVVDHSSPNGYHLTVLGKGVADRIIDLFMWLKEQPGFLAETSVSECGNSIAPTTVATAQRSSPLERQVT